jgi:U3 small nucleolar RNA-associated protein 20
MASSSGRDGGGHGRTNHSSSSANESATPFRFEKLSQKLQKINVDIVHRVIAPGSMDLQLHAAPSTGEQGCFLQDELDQLRHLDTTTSFKQFQVEIWPLVQSLPELIHHQDKVVSLLIRQIGRVVPDELRSYFQLVCVLARYARAP